MESRSLHKVTELLNRLERTEGESGDLTSTLQHIAQTAHVFFAADDAVIFAINPITGRFVESLTIAGDLIETEVPFEQPGPQGITQQVLRQTTLVVENLEITPEYHSTFTRAEGILAFVGLALYTKHSQKPLGVLYLNFRRAQHFDTNDKELFQLFSDQASYILQETWLLRRHREVARIGYEINQELSTVDTLFQKLLQHATGILDITYTLLLTVYQQENNIFNLYMQEEGHFFLLRNEPAKGASRYIIETQRVLFIRQMSHEVEYLPFQRFPIPGSGERESFIFVPLVLRGVSLGMLSIQHPEPHAYNQDDQFILELLANHVALALHNIRLYENLNQLNETGQLLTQQLEAEQVIQMTVDKILGATKADLVGLYPYEPLRKRFTLPPRIAGNLLDPTSYQAMSPSQPDDMAALMLQRSAPLFAKEGITLYQELLGKSPIRERNFQQREYIRSVAAIPLQVGDETVGVLFVNFRQPQRFDAPQKILIEGLAHYAAIAIKNAQTYGLLIQRRIHELETLRKIDLELSRTLELETVLNTLLKLACEHVPAEEAAIFLPNSRTQVLEVPAAIGPYAETRRIVTISLQEAKGITQWVMKHKQPARVNNIHEDPWKEIYISVLTDVVSELDIPLIDNEEVVGVLNFESSKESAFSQEDEDFLVTLAGQAVLAIKNAQAYEREKRLLREAQTLNEISKEITSQLDPNSVFHLILKKALELTRSDTGNLMLYDTDRNNLRMAAEQGVAEDKKGQSHGIGQGIVGHVARTRKLLNVDLSQPPWDKINLDYFPGTRSELAVPMLAGNDLIGVLNIESLAPNNFGESDERLLEGLADLAVIAVQNTEAYEREKRLAAESQVLNEISKEITSQLDSFSAFDFILKEALELTKCTRGSLHLYDSDLNDLEMVADQGVAEARRGGVRQRLGEGIVGYVAVRRELCNVKDISQPPWDEIYMNYIPGTRSELAVPMLAGDQLRGVLNVESTTLAHFKESDERLLQGLAGLAVIALQNAERYKKAEREAQNFELLYRAGRELGEIADWEQLEQAYDIILRIAEEHSQCQVVIRHYDDIAGELLLARAWRSENAPPSSTMKLDEGLNGQVARERRTKVIYDVNNLPSDVTPPIPSNPATQSLVITPIQFKDRYYGNLALGHEEIGHFRGTEINFFEGLADQLASTLYRLETVKERQEFEQISSVGQAAFEVTHRLANYLGLVQFYTNDILSELKKLGISNTLISEKLEAIEKSVKAVLSFSNDLKQVSSRLGEKEEKIILPKELLAEATVVPSLPSTIQIQLDEHSNDVAPIRVIHKLVLDILHNLITNAIQAMPQGGKITLGARNVGRFVALEVTDTGSGIPPEKQSKVFDLFVSTKGSSGFGLWSARRYAIQNHGVLKLEKSQPGEGTTFLLLLPRADGGTN